MSTMTRIVALIVFIIFMCDHYLWIIFMIIFITFFDIGISNPASGKIEYAQLSTRKNASIRLNLAKPKAKYGDHYLCRTKRIEDRRHLTAIAPVKS